MGLRREVACVTLVREFTLPGQEPATCCTSRLGSSEGQGSMEREGTWKWVNKHGAYAPYTFPILTILLAVVLQQINRVQI